MTTNDDLIAEARKYGLRKLADALESTTSDRDKWRRLWEQASNAVIALQGEAATAVQQPTLKDLSVPIFNAITNLQVLDNGANRSLFQVEADRISVRAAEGVLAALPIPATGEVEWGVYCEREGVFYACTPPTKANAERQAVLAGEAHRPVTKDLGRELSNAWSHGRMREVEKRRAEMTP